MLRDTREAGLELGELFRLDTIRLTPLPDRSTSVMVRFRIEPDRIKSTRPNFAKYLDKYVSPARYRLRLLDGRGPIWLDAAEQEITFTLSYRVRDRELVALSGTPTPMPDSLKIALDFSAKFMIFRVGVTSLIGDFVFDSPAGELRCPAGRRLRLTRSECGLLDAFARNPNRVLSRDELLGLVHGDDADSFDRSIDMRIARIRRKIEADPAQPVVIRTARGAGYIFDCREVA